jgi:glycosyltransferase involved in cell wall biosynthesis
MCAVGRAEDNLVSIVIPTYNHGRYLPEAIRSAMAQTYRGVEIVVVDDGSSDNTRELVSRIEDERIRYVWQPNRGLSSARNTGLRASRGPFVVFLDADDRLLPHQTEFGLRALISQPGLGLVCGDIRPFGQLGTFRHVHCCSPAPDHYGTLLRSCFIVNVGACMFPRTVLEEMGGFDERLPSSEDWDLFLRIARSYPIHCHHIPVLEYRRVPGQMSENLEVMLRGAAHVLRSNRTYAMSRREYRDAYREGQKDIAKYYGAPMVELLLNNLRQYNWSASTRLAFRVLRDSPRGLVWYAHQHWRPRSD